MRSFNGDPGVDSTRASNRLITLLQDCVAGCIRGLPCPPAGRAGATAYWQGIEGELADGVQALGGVRSASPDRRPATPPYCTKGQQAGAEVEKLMVHSRGPWQGWAAPSCEAMEQGAGMPGAACCAGHPGRRRGLHPLSSARLSGGRSDPEFRPQWGRHPGRHPVLLPSSSEAGADRRPPHQASPRAGLVHGAAACRHGAALSLFPFNPDPIGKRPA